MWCLVVFIPVLKEENNGRLGDIGNGRDNVDSIGRSFVIDSILTGKGDEDGTADGGRKGKQRALDS